MNVVIKVCQKKKVVIKVDKKTCILKKHTNKCENSTNSFFVH